MRQERQVDLRLKGKRGNRKGGVKERKEGNKEREA
jgi:hypothetical protein